MRGQAHTLEATVAALLMLSSLIFALQMTAVTPLSASTSSQHIENQQQATGQGVLAAAANANALKPAILYWDNSNAEFHNADTEYYYTASPPDNTFGHMLNRSFNNQSIAYNVRLRRAGGSGNQVTMRYIYSGEPSDNAVMSTHTVTLNDDDKLYAEDATPTGTSISDSASTHRINYDSGSGSYYNTVQVELIAWRI